MRTFTDDYIEHWGHVFVANALERRGLTFGLFIERPQHYLAASVFERPTPAEEPRPLLPRQVTVARRLLIQETVVSLESLLENELARDVPDVRARGAAGLHEPLHHHAHPERRMRRCSFRPRTGGAA